MESWSHLLQLLGAYGDAWLLPLAVIEGPILAVVTGFLCARGYLAWYWVLMVLVCGDLIGDLVAYWVGRLTRTPLAAFGRRLHLPAEKCRDLAQRLEENDFRILLIGKWTHAIGSFVLLGAGAARLPLLRFLLINLLATVPKVGLLFGIGYFAGNFLGVFDRHLLAGTILLFLLGAAAVLLVLRRHPDPGLGGSAR